MLKFILGPIGGYASGLHVITTMISTVLGMMTMVLVFTYGGNWLREKVFKRFRGKGKKFSERNRRFTTIWKKYGLTGVAFLTPLILTPIGGTLLAVSSGSPKEKIIYYMLISAAIWSVVFTAAIYFFGNEIMKFLPEFAK